MIKKLNILFLALTLMLCCIYVTPVSAITSNNYSNIYKSNTENKQPLKTPERALLIRVFYPYIQDAFKEQNIPACDFDEESSTVLSVNKLSTGEYEIKFYIATYTNSHKPPYRIYIVTVITDGVNTKVTNIEAREPIS